MRYKCDGCDKVILSVGMPEKKITVQSFEGKFYRLCNWSCVNDWAYGISDGQIELEDE